MDALLKQLSDVAIILLPILGVLCLILLAMGLYQLYRFLKRLPQTLTGVDQTIASVNNKVDMLEKPLHALGEVSQTVEVANQSAVGVISHFTKMAIQSSEQIVDTFKFYKDKRQEQKDEKRQAKEHRQGDNISHDRNVKDTERSSEHLDDEEDFGIYE